MVQYRWLEGSWERILDGFSHGHFDDSHLEDIARFWDDLAAGRRAPYLPAALQPAKDLRHIYHLAPRGLVAVVADEPDGETVWLDLVSLYIDPEAVANDPWGLP